MNTPWLGSRLCRVLAYLAAWTLIAFFLMTQDATRALYYQKSVNWKLLLVVWLTDAYLWALLAPLVWFLSKRLPLRRATWWRALPVHLACGGVLAVVHAALFAIATVVLGFPLRPTLPGTFLAVLPIDFHLNLAIYWFIMGVQHTAVIYGRYQERETKAAQLELRASELQRQLVESKLDALRMQLHPHFLFNALNAIVVLVRQSKTREADEMLTDLSELLRHTLDGWEMQEIPLRSEIEFLRLYLNIERVRFQDRLTVEIAVAPETMGALVPSLLLQPVVENAIRHGIAKKPVRGNVILRARRTDSMLEVQVCDDGPGLPAGNYEAKGVGLSNTRARLQQLYGEHQSLRLESPGYGTVATITLPYHLETHPIE